MANLPRLLITACACLVSFTLGAAQSGRAAPRERAPAPLDIKVVDGVVQPRRPISVALTDAIQFLRRADNGYTPGNIDGPLAGYFMRALVNADGSQPDRPQLSYPARQHAYFIRTFLHYYAYSGEVEWLLRARDLADWNIRHSTPATAAYANLPYSSWQHNQPTGSADKHSIETDKPAFLGDAYLSLYEATGNAGYLAAARRIATTLVAKQRDDGSWPFRVIPEDGRIYEDLGGAPVFFVQFFEHLLRHDAKTEYTRARSAALQLMIARNVEQGQWGTYHEDIQPKPGTHLSAEPMSFTAAYLFRHSEGHPEYIAMGRRVLQQMEAALVFTTGHPVAPAPAVAEQATFAHIMAGHTARYCMALAELYRATGDETAKQRALSGLNAVTYMQSPAGLFRTHFFDTKTGLEKDPAKAPNWYSQHLYAVCHLLECMALLPEIAPRGENHILGTSVAVHDVRYGSNSVAYASMLPAEATLRLNFQPAMVTIADRPLPRHDAASRDEGWWVAAGDEVIQVRHGAGAVRLQR